VNPEAQELARRFGEANDEVTAFVEACDEAQWQTTVPGEQWPVGVVLHHVAVGHLLVRDWLESARQGRPIDVKAAEIDADNARHAVEFAAVSRPETLEELRRNGAALAAVLAGLSADDLAATVAFGPADGRIMTTAQLAPATVNHCTSHLAAVRRALQAESG